MRPAGHTLRMLLRTFEHVLSNDRQHALVMFATQEAKEHAFFQAIDMGMPVLRNFMTVHKVSWNLTFKNESIIMFRNADFVERDNWKGLDITKAERDNSFDSIDVDSRFLYHWRELESVVDRNRKK